MGLPGPVREDATKPAAPGAAAGWIEGAAWGFWSEVIYLAPRPISQTRRGITRSKVADDQRGEKRARKVWRELRKSSRGSGLRMTDRSSESGGRPPRLETTDINLCHGPTPSQRRGSCSLR